MRDHVAALERLAARGRDAWRRNPTVRAASRFHLAALGRGASRVPEPVRRKDAAIPWDALALFPRLLEDPWGVDEATVWGTMVAVAALAPKLAALEGEGASPEVA